MKFFFKRKQKTVISNNEVYALEGKLGSGKKGTVYKATDKSNRVVALKRLKNRKLATQSAAIVHQLDSSCPKTPILYDKAYWVVMPYHEGQNLKAYLQEYSSLSVSDAARLFLALIDELDALKEKKILHRDIKPANIVIFESNGNIKAHLVDFDRSVQIGKETDWRLNAKVGARKFLKRFLSQPWMAPEHYALRKQDIDPHQSDCYSLGYCATEVLRKVTVKTDEEKKGLNDLKKWAKELQSVDPEKRPELKIIRGDLKTKYQPSKVREKKSTSSNVLSRLLKSPLSLPQSLSPLVLKHKKSVERVPQRLNMLVRTFFNSSYKRKRGEALDQSSVRCAK